jgi:hypothetical protein
MVMLALLTDVDTQEGSVSFNLIVTDLKRMYPQPAEDEKPSATGLCEADVERWSAAMGCPKAVLYDQIATYLALGYYNSQLTFYFCDAIANSIHTVITFGDVERPELFAQVFLAFDSGEYYHNNNRDEDPEQTYTRPRIAQIIKDYRLSEPL